MPTEAIKETKEKQSNEPLFVSNGKRIIKMGKRHKALRTCVFSCSTCECVFEADEDNYTTTWVGGEVYYYTSCPCCGRKVYGDYKHE